MSSLSDRPHTRGQATSQCSSSAGCQYTQLGGREAGRGRNWTGGEVNHKGVGPSGGFHCQIIPLAVAQAARNGAPQLTTSKIAGFSDGTAAPAGVSEFKIGL